jgi:hypothetical protein
MVEGDLGLQQVPGVPLCSTRLDTQQSFDLTTGMSFDRSVLFGAHTSALQKELGCLGLCQLSPMIIALACPTNRASIQDQG